MIESAVNVTPSAPTPTRRIEIRLTLTQRTRYDKGKLVKDGPDPDRLLQALRPALKTLLQHTYGTHTEITAERASVNDIRFHGPFPGRKVTELREEVGELIGLAFEELDLGGE